MSTPKDETNVPPSDPRHERLCAYLFGELDDAERAAVEAELAASPELRSAKAELEATIDLVREAVPVEEALPASSRAALMRSATGEETSRTSGDLAPIHPWPVRLARHPVTAAAAILAVVTGFSLWQQGGRGAVHTPMDSGDSDVAARLEDEDAKSEWGADADGAANPRKEGFGKDGGDARGKLGETLAVPEAHARAAEPRSAPEGPPGVRQQAEDSARFGQAPEAEEVAPDPLSTIDINGFGGGSGTPTFDTPVAGVELRALEELGDSEGFLGVVDEAAPAEPKEQQLAENLRSSLATASGGGGAYRGPGDSTPPAVQDAAKKSARLLRRAPASGGGGAAAGPSGPSSPGPTTGSNLISSGGARPGAPKAAEPSGGAAGRPFLDLNDALAAAGRGRVLAGDDDRGHGADEFFLGLGFERAGKAGVDPATYCDEIVRFCRIRPNETPSDMFFRCWGDNPFELARLDALSTFAADVDTASYALARNYLKRGLMPTKAQVRTEEFVNYFDSGVPAPTESVFDLDLELAPSRFGRVHGEDAWMLRCVVRGKEVDAAERQHLALTFVIDVSGSMEQENRLELVKHAMRLLVGELYPNDAIAIVVFSNEARTVLPMTSAANKAVIESAIYGLTPGGGTNAEAGLRMGYAIADQELTSGSNNRVVLLSDGVANIGDTSEDGILASIGRHRSKGIYLNTIGVGMGNHNDALLEQLADKGDGVCNYIDTPEEARKVLVEDFTGAFQPIARDVKIQVEFDPAQVTSYRLLGYENRTVADVDFRNDAVDAGEVNAGHQVTALYEIVRQPGAALADGPLATMRVRYKPPFAVDLGRTDAAAAEQVEKAAEISASIDFRTTATSFEGATPGYRRAVLVAQFAELLRRSVHARGDSYDELLLEARALEPRLADPAFTELFDLMSVHRDLIVAHLPRIDELTEAVEELTRRHYLKGQLEQLTERVGDVEDLSADLLQELQEQNERLESRIRELIEKELEVQER